MNTAKEILDQIEKARAMHSSLFTMFIECSDPDSQRTFKTALDSQMKAMHGLIVNYRKAREREEEDEHDAKWEEKESRRMAGFSKGDLEED